MIKSTRTVPDAKDPSLESALNAADGYLNAGLPVEERVELLLSSMSVEEKVNQLTSAYAKTDQEGNAPGGLAEEFKTRLEQGLGSVQFVNLPHDAGQSAELANMIQTHLLDQSGRGIPVLLVGEACHGLIAHKATSFPQAIALASTWNPALVERVYAVAAKEARSRGNHLMNTPVLDLARDPRWGRMEETYGEDVHMVTQMGLAAVRGLQGVGETVDANRVVSTLKHFAAYGQCDGGRNFAPTNVPRRLFMEEILEPFRQVFSKAQAWGVMPSHSEVDGVPAHGDGRLLVNLLRKEWGFKGVVVSDYHDIHRLDLLHHVVPTQQDAALLALRAGVTLDFPEGASYRTLIESLDCNPEYRPDLDDRVREVLTLKFMLGLFEQPFVDAGRAVEIQDDPEKKNLALEAAEKAVILLKNSKHTLPLDKGKLKRIAVIGPNAEETILGGYSHWMTSARSIKDGLEDYLTGSDVEICFARGCGITAGGKTFAQLETGEELNTPVETIPYDVEQESIRAAAEMAKGCDVAVVCVGDDYFSTREAFYMRETLGDRGSIDLVGNQEALVQAVIETGTPTVVVLMHGRSISINYANAHAAAILDGWYLGEETATAICKTLFGENNPGGKLVVSVPRSSAHLPCHYSQRHSANWKGYLFEDSSPLYSFGFGLSYTTFRLDNIALSASVIQAGDSCGVSLDVTNTGQMAGDEVVQIYLRDVVGSTTRPDRMLKAFRRVSLEPGQTKHLSLTLDAEAFEMIDLDFERVIEPGAFTVFVGTSSRMEDLVELTLFVE
ncbi:Beta-glucosidase BoGH3B [Pontiella desulfatans]|uniref:Beta-glucosidase BoGH3B n=1 Tax=Pontiella desulfatans TaxID=2750659 RepID=A0A6C2TY60_PONDE|nr:glycoside hydrolase family 3 N-terminal domain-containing protein [Pontiella desulfatans]VGO12539.1 Beta-glucosidase BoGH3B [Pontiella desulfatans]